MYGNVNQDRWSLLAAAVAAGGRAAGQAKDRFGTREWAAAVGVSLVFFAPGYRSRRSTDLVKRAVIAAARGLGLDPDRLARWICCAAADAELEARLYFEMRRFRCTGEGPHDESSVQGLEPGWFDKERDRDKLIVVLRRCKMCASRASMRAKSGSRTSATWEEMIRERGQALPERIRQAVAAIEATGHALTYERVATLSGMDKHDVRRAFAQLDLEKPRKGRFRPSRYKKAGSVLIFLSVLRLLSVEEALASGLTKKVVRPVAGRRRRDGELVELSDLPPIRPVLPGGRALPISQPIAIDPHKAHEVLALCDWLLALGSALEEAAPRGVRVLALVEVGAAA